MTEAAASQQICKLGVVPIRTNREMIRADEADLVHKSETGKFTVVAHEVLNAKHHEREFASVGSGHECICNARRIEIGVADALRKGRRCRRSDDRWF